MPRQKIYPSISQQDAIYFAGFFDGEGSIIIYGRKSYPSTKGKTLPHNLRITVSNTNQQVMLWIHKTFGGQLQFTKSSLRAGSNRAAAWKWIASCAHAGHILKAIAPFLKVKSDEAEIALEFQERTSNQLHNTHKGVRGAAAVSLEEVAIRDALAQRLRDLRQAKKHYVKPSD